MWGCVSYVCTCRSKREITDTGRELNGVLKQYNDAAKPVSLSGYMSFGDLVEGVSPAKDIVSNSASYNREERSRL